MGLDAGFRDLIVGTAGSSPFLKTLLESEREWVEAALDDAPDAVVASLLSDTDALQPSDLKTGLRKLRRRVALFAGLADLAGVWSVMDVTQALTDFADRSVAAAFGASVAREAERGKLPVPLSERPMHGLCVLAMGKMGAHELNYSSDIDLIVLFDETAFDPDAFEEARHSFVRATRNTVGLLSDTSGGGFVFRTDLRLRPDPSVTPVAMSMGAAERYYEALGRTWERAAYIKARPAAGDLEAGDAFLQTLSPFLWRRTLDFAALRDAHDMRLKIQAHKRMPGLPAYRGRDLKLGPGGIREIEFFTQTRQLIAGGRDPSLRSRRTLDGLSALHAAEWIGASELEVLSADYCALREAEHRIQMIADQQTHVVPVGEENFGRMAALMDLDPEALGREIEERGKRVAAIAEQFFAPSTPAARVQTPLKVPEQWVSYPALRSPRAVEIFERVRPALLERIAKTSDPDAVLDHFGTFLMGLPAGVQLFALFEANPQLIELLVDICDTAPSLATYLGRNASVLDAVIAGGFFDPWPGVDEVADDLASATQAGDYEERLNALRGEHKDWHFRIGVHHLRGLITAAEAGEQYADLAEAVIRVLWPIVVDDFALRFGPPPGQGAALIAMGSLGARRLNAASDLDLILIYDADPTEASNGPRSLPAATYFGRLTKTLMTALTAPMGNGRLYEVDMRLRPSGRQGPVATSLSSFAAYQRSEAWVWEHLALTRARTVVGSTSVRSEIEGIRSQVLAAPKPRAQVMADLDEMRTRLAAAHAPTGPFDVRNGQGSLMDIELLAQAAAYLSTQTTAPGLGDQLQTLDVLDMADADQKALNAAARLFWSVHAARNLAGLAATSAPDEITGGLKTFLLREAGQDTPEALAASLSETSDACAKIVNHTISANLASKIRGG